MIVVDSSVWIDYFNGVISPVTNRLDELLGADPIAVGDIILAEVLLGFRRDADYRRAKRLMQTLAVVAMLGPANAVRCAENYRWLRKRGVTVRKTIDLIIATWCIENGCALLFQDRDFLPFVEHLGLRSARAVN